MQDTPWEIRTACELHGPKPTSGLSNLLSRLAGRLRAPGAPPPRHRSHLRWPEGLWTDVEAVVRKGRPPGSSVAEAEGASSTPEPQPTDSAEEPLPQGLPPTHLFETLAVPDWKRHWSMKTPGRNAWEVYSSKGTQRSMPSVETSPDANDSRGYAATSRSAYVSRSGPIDNAHLVSTWPREPPEPYEQP